MRVLFISAPIGAGHIKAAQAVARALQEMDASCATQMVNVFDFLPPLLGRLILGSYLKVLDLFPQLYALMYGWGNVSPLALWGRRIVSRLLANRLERYLSDWKPDLVVCSHATPAGLVADLAARKRLNVPTVAVVTDYVVHRLWVYPEIEQYVVAHEELSDFLAGYGIAKTRVACNGIPVSAQFGVDQPTERKAVLRELTLSEARKTVLLMGGGAGLLPMESILAAALEAMPEVQWIAVAGKNKALFQRLQELQKKWPEQLRAFGYHDQVHRLMDAADLLVSKPGGLTVAEALCEKLPIIIYRPIPGQEEANTAYLLKQQVALRAESTQEIIAMLRRLLYEQPSELEMMTVKAQQLGRPNAAAEVADWIYKRIALKNSEKC